MGQQCAKENQTKASPNAPTEIDLKQSKGPNSLQSAYRPYLAHPNIEEILSRLSQAQLLLFLVSFFFLYSVQTKVLL